MQIHGACCRPRSLPECLIRFSSVCFLFAGLMRAQTRTIVAPRNSMEKNRACDQQMVGSVKDGFLATPKYSERFSAIRLSRRHYRIVFYAWVHDMLTVLVVEDESLIREFITEELESAGYTVKQAAHADDAIAVLEAHHNIHLVFTDVDMPGSMDGLKLAAYVRDRWPPVHIIVTSGKTRPPIVPADVLFLPKPYIGKTVIAAIRTFESMY